MDADQTSAIAERLGRLEATALALADVMEELTEAVGAHGGADPADELRIVADLDRLRRELAPDTYRELRTGLG